PPAHASCLEMLAPVMTMREGARMYAPGGQLLHAGDRLEQPGLVAALESLAGEGAAGAYTGTIGRSLLALSEERGGLLTQADLESYEPQWNEPVAAVWHGLRVLTRGGLSGVAVALERLPPLRGLPPAERVLALLEALDGVPAPETHTTNLAVADAEGNACVLTTSLPRFRRLAAGPRPAPEQHARGGRSAARADGARAAHAEHDGAERRARRRGPRPRGRRRRRDAAAHCARGRRRRDPRRGPLAPGGRRPAARAR